MRNRRCCVSIGLFLRRARPFPRTRLAVNPQAHRATSAHCGPPQSSNPYAKLFDARTALKQAVAASEAQETASKSTIVCGMTIIEADPYFDPKMTVTPPKDDNVRYTIRAVDPSVCNSSRK